MSFRAKVALQILNFAVSWWLMVVLFAMIPRLCIVVSRDPLGREIGAMLGIIYSSYAFVKQLKQTLEGVVSISITCYTVATRKPPQQQTIQQQQMD